MANRNGLNHKVRGFKGVGFNRALPAAFGFDKCVQGDYLNDYFQISNLNNAPCPQFVTVEFWAIPRTGAGRSGLFSISFNGSNTRTLGVSFDNNFQSAPVNTAGMQIFYSVFQTQIPRGNNSIADTKHHIVLIFDNVNRTTTAYINNVNTTTHSWAGSGLAGPNTTFGMIRLLFAVAGDISNPYNYGGDKFDQFRIYNIALSPAQIALNYNNGSGENPCVTENLLVWLAFDSFEALDFSVAQDGSDIRLGIMDRSGKNNHAQSFNMDTDPSSGTYVLKPF